MCVHTIIHNSCVKQGLSHCSGLKEVSGSSGVTIILLYVGYSSLYVCFEVHGKFVK